MYIKQVIIEGFKSYKEQVATEPFDAKHNCVVGANGSGKTNFFHAIRFVLSDLFHNLRAEDRQALLHEGAGHQVMSAFVEIVFENSDNRIPVDREEVRLRRTIGLKKDEYFLDKKHITKAEVMNLLESAGFSRSNPYYVVQQGKINQLTLMKDTDRLELLKEIGGTRVYEERRRESLKILQDTESRRKQIMEVVSTIEDRLRELDAEKEELQKYQQLDKQRRSLEYTIFDKELTETREKLDEIEEARALVSEKSNAMHNTVRESHERLKATEKELKVVNRSLQDFTKGMEAAEEQRQAAIQASAKLEMEVKELEEMVAAETTSKDETLKELQKIEQEAETLENSLVDVRPTFEQLLAEEAEIQKTITENEQLLGNLYQRQSRKSQFSSKSNRDNFLNAELERMRSLMSQQSAQVKKLEEDMQRINGSSMELSSQRSDKQAQLQELERQAEETTKEHFALKHQRDELNENRKKLWKEDQSISEAMASAKSEIDKAEKQLDLSTPGDLRRAMQGLKEIIRTHSILGVHGPLLELISCEDKFNIAVEVTAGNSLFNVVVETDDIAGRLVKYLNQKKCGRMTFIPLNQARAPTVNYPQGPDVVPLLQKLNFNSEYTPAFGQIFGRTIICRDMVVATNTARSGDFDCITLDGSQVARKGAMTGGHHDHRRSKLKLLGIIRNNRQKFVEVQETSKRVKGDLEKLDQEISRTLGEIEKVEAKQRHLRNSSEQLKLDLNSLKQEEDAGRVALKEKEQLLQKAKDSFAQHRASYTATEKELGTDMVDGLTPEDRDLVSRLNAELPGLKDRLLKCKTSRLEVETKIGQTELYLSENLLRRQEELNTQLAGLNINARTSELQLRRDEVQMALNNADEAKRQSKDILEQTEKFLKRVRDLVSQRDELKQAEDLYERTLQDEAKDLEQLLNRKTTHLNKRESLMKKIRDLGSLPSDAFEKYQNKNLKDLHKLLHKTNEQLKKYSSVNKKALDQYVNFTERREELHQRQAELDNGDEKIKELINVLDQRKDEAIERTFKGVAKNFRETFAELVPNGSGSLVMMKKRKADEVADDEDEDEDGERERNRDGQGRIEKYVGVKVKVSFTGKGETQSMKQLSGGQKTVVALTLIFAIQRCDPAPFYLFDEIDAALDPQYRTAVGSMIRTQADTSQTQFITTTFRPELLKVADRIYGVFHKNRVSNVRIVSKEEALRFIEQDQSHHD